MNRSVFLAAVTCGFVAGGVGGAFAQDPCSATGTLTSAVGNVMVDRGAGFTPGGVGASLKAGDKVAVLGNGSAVVSFGENKVVNVPSATTETLRAPGCVVAATDPALGILGTMVLGGGIAAAISMSTDDNDSPRQISP